MKTKIHVCVDAGRASMNVLEWNVLLGARENRSICLVDGMTTWMGGCSEKGSYQRHRPRNRQYIFFLFSSTFFDFSRETVCRARHHNELDN